MRPRIRRRYHASRYVLSPQQRALIDAVAASLGPEQGATSESTPHHSFRLIVSRILEMSRNQQTGHCTDALVQRAIAVALEETMHMRRETA